MATKTTATPSTTTSTATASITDCSVNNTCLSGGSSSTVIILGSCIPILVACVVLFFIHRAHLKRVRREEKNDKDFDMDAGVGELPAPGPGSHASGLGALEKQGPYREGSTASLKDMDLQPPPPALPYLVPKAHVSRESLHSLSDPRDNPYAAIYTSAPPSPSVGAFSPFSDQASISGRSGRSLLAPSSLPYDQNPNLPLRPPSRAPSPLAIADYQQQQSTQQSRGESPPNVIGDSRGHSIDFPPSSPARSRPRSPLRERQVQAAEENHSNPFAMESTIEEKNTEPPRLSTVEPETYIKTHINSEPISTFELPEVQNIQSNNKSERTIDNMRASREVSAYNPGVEARGRDSLIERESFYGQPSEKYQEFEQRIEGEADEDRAKRIQSVYKEYWSDSQYYDGSEDWEASQQTHRQDAAYEPRPPMPVKNSRPAWRDSAQDYYEAQNWQPEDTRGYQYQHYEEPQHRSQIGLGIEPHWDSPLPRPSHYSRPSTSYSTSSVPSRARTPSKPLEPLQNLPNRYKLDELASPISFSKPRRFAGSAGRDSPARSASPAQVLSSSWSNLAELPVPHRLRRSGSFSSLDFAPVRKFAGSEVDAGDTGSIRSFSRTEASLMAVSAGAGRVDRLPQDIVPMGKSGAMANLRPQNYGDIRYF